MPKQQPVPGQKTTVAACWFTCDLGDVSRTPAWKRALARGSGWSVRAWGKSSSSSASSSILDSVRVAWSMANRSIHAREKGGRKKAVPERTAPEYCHLDRASPRRFRRPRRRRLGQPPPLSRPRRQEKSRARSRGFFPVGRRTGLFPGRGRGEMAGNDRDFYPVWPNWTVLHSPNRFFYGPNFFGRKWWLPGPGWPKRTRPKTKQKFSDEIFSWSKSHTVKHEWVLFTQNAVGRPK
jgi:hypothetical protein